MELIRFAKWWYKSASVDEKMSIASIVIILVFGTIVFTKGFFIGILSMLALIAFILVWALVDSITKHVKGKWIRFKTIQEREAQEIVDRLAGKQRRY